MVVVVVVVVVVVMVVMVVVVVAVVMVMVVVVVMMATTAMTMTMLLIMMMTTMRFHVRSMLPSPQQRATSPAWAKISPCPTPLLPSGNPASHSAKSLVAGP